MAKLNICSILALAIATLLLGCKTNYTLEEMMFINAFHDKDTFVYVSNVNEQERDTVYFSKEKHSKIWLPGFRDGMKYSDEVSINCKVNDTAKNAFETSFILLARAQKSVFTDIMFKSFSCRFDSCNYCCLQDTTFILRNGKTIEPPIYNIHYKLGVDTTVPRNGHDVIKTIWFSPTKGLIRYDYVSGKTFVRIE